MPTVLVCEAYEGLQEAFQLMLEGWVSVRLTANTEDYSHELNRREQIAVRG